MKHLCAGEGTPLPTAARTGAVSTPYELETAVVLLGRGTEHVWKGMDETEECIRCLGC